MAAHFREAKTRCFMRADKMLENNMFSKYRINMSSTAQILKIWVLNERIMHDYVHLEHYLQCAE